MVGEYAVTGFAVPESIDLLHALLDEVRTDHPEVVEADLSMLETAVIEIAGNVVRHAAEDGTTLYEFRLWVRPHELVGELVYEGEDPDLPADPQLPEDSAESGRGLVLAQAVLDDLEHSFVDGRNRWRMVRRRQPEQQQV